MNKTRDFLSRRNFTRYAAGALTALTVVPRHVLGASASAAPSDKLQVACIGVGGRGGACLGGVRSETVVGLCDVDMGRAGGAFKKYPRAEKFRDFRRMLDRLEKKIDAVTVATPDHTHAVAAMNAIQRGKHVYCEKPLAHSIGEIRALMQAARKHKVKTQLGNQGHSSGHIRRCCEWIWDGAIGQVHTIHAACSANHCKIRELPRRSEKHAVPEGLDWDLWLGPAKYRSYHDMYIRGRWRGWLPFGSGTIGDWVCHVVDPSFWALDLGAPTSIQADAENYDPVEHADTVPAGSRVIFKFPAKGKRGPVTLYWYSGTRTIPQPEGLEPNRKPPKTGAVILGTKGGIMHGSHGAGGVKLFPEKRMKAYKQPAETIPRVPGHFQDWLLAIKTGREAASNFDYGGPLTELAQLGIIALRRLGEELKWDGKAMRFTNCAAANAFIDPPARKGWTL